MIPINLLTTSIGHQILVEIKSGEQFTGTLVNCDVWMNLHLKEVTCKSIPSSSSSFSESKVSECFLRGNSIKYLSVPNEIADKLLEHAKRKQQQRDGGDSRDKREKNKRTSNTKKTNEKREMPLKNKRQ